MGVNARLTRELEDGACVLGARAAPLGGGVKVVLLGIMGMPIGQVKVNGSLK